MDALGLCIQVANPILTHKSHPWFKPFLNVLLSFTWKSCILMSAVHELPGVMYSSISCLCCKEVSLFTF